MKRKQNLEPAAPGFEGRPPNREVHWHLFPAVDVPLTPDTPHQDILRAAIENCELQEATLSGFQVLISEDWLPGERFTFVLEIEHTAAHSMPSGASADRRLWVEVVAFDDRGRVVLESGKIADGELEEKPAGDPAHDPQLRVFRDYLVDAEGRETHMFWDAAKLERSELMPFAKKNEIGTHTATRTFITSDTQPAARIELRLRLRPMGIDVLQDLVRSGHLDEAVIDAMPTHTVTHQEAILSADKQSYEMRYPAAFEDSPDCTKFVRMFEDAIGD